MHHPRHLPAALASVGLVLVLHGWLLSVMPRSPAQWRGDPAPAPRAVQVRQIVAAPVAAATALPASPPRPVLQPSARPLLRQPPAAFAPAPPAAYPDQRDQSEQQPQQNAQDPPAATPVYATRLAPPVTLHYKLRRGSATGNAVLRWAPDAGRYELTLRGQVLAAPNVAWASVGAIDAHGIAPDRYTEIRRGRELRAANFQRDSARITFSGPQLEYPLPPGAQDRLSWMLQLGAVIAADPSLAEPGRQVLLFVAGGRGDAGVWTFTVQGSEPIELPGAGSVDTLLLRREPRSAYDTLVQVWLDPARHHLPVRADLAVRAETTELLLETLTLP